MLFHCPVSSQDEHFHCWETHLLPGPSSQGVGLKTAQMQGLTTELSEELLIPLLVPMLSGCFNNPRVLPVTRNNEELAMTAVSELWELVCTVKNNPNSF